MNVWFNLPDFGFISQTLVLSNQWDVISNVAISAEEKPFLPGRKPFCSTENQPCDLN